MGPVNILADFCNRDVRFAAGLKRNLSDRTHARVLAKWINLSALLTKDFCVIPKSFVTECSILLNVLAEAIDLCNAQVLMFSSRDYSDESLTLRRREDYRRHHEQYDALYSDKHLERLVNLRLQTLERRSHSSTSIAENWLHRADDDIFWNYLLSDVPARELDRLRSEPTRLISNDEAVLWHAIEDSFSLSENQQRAGRNLLNRDMLSSYLFEYELGVCTNLPFGWRDLRFDRKFPNLDYRNFQVFFGSTLTNVLLRLRPEEVLRLRQSSRFLIAMENYRSLIAASKNDSAVLARQSAVLRENAEADLHKLEALFGPVLSPTTGKISLSNTEWNYTLSALGYMVEERKGRPTRMKQEQSKGETQKQTVAIFTALEEEAKVVIRKFKLESTEYLLWKGVDEEYDLWLYRAEGMGRVNAAVATSRLFEHVIPDILLVVGIAGGFGDAGSKPGHIIIPDNVVDLAVRKSFQDEGAQFRPKVFNTANAVKVAINSPGFNQKAWSDKAHEELDWPDDSRPAIRYGDISSLDEVVSSISHQEAILKAYPKLLGVGMEAGGVCAQWQRLKRYLLQFSEACLIRPTLQKPMIIGGSW